MKLTHLIRAATASKKSAPQFYKIVYDCKATETYAKANRIISKGHVTDSAWEMQTAITLTAFWGFGILFVSKIWGGDHGLKAKFTHTFQSGTGGSSSSSGGH